VLAAQSLVIVVAVLVYFVWLAREAAFVALVMLGVAFLVARRRWLDAYARLQASRDDDNALFDGMTDLVEGFKEVRLHRERGADLDRFVARISEAVAAVRADVDTRLIRLFLFVQTSFYVAAAAMVFLFPTLDRSFGADAFQTTTVILFLVGPISAVTSAASAVVKAAAAAAGLFHLDQVLRAAARPAVAAPPLTTFGEIRLEDVTYQHREENDQPGFFVGPLSLTLTRGELVFILGGNGSGKTTLLKLVTALYAPRSGSLRVDGRPVTGAERDAYRGLFSAVFADFHLFHRPFGLEDVAPAHFERWLDEMELTGKTELVDGRFTTVDLSTGQRKRLALITALLEDRPIYVFDEWAADQDPSFRRKFYDEIVPGLSARGKTVVVVTHDERYIRQGHRVLSMEDGRLRVPEDV
jgi:putative ATP-binding cassette transporter